jgi:hypothetical protein
MLCQEEDEAARGRGLLDGKIENEEMQHDQFAADLSRGRVAELQAILDAAHVAPPISRLPREQLKHIEEEIRREKRQYIVHVKQLRKLRAAAEERLRSTEPPVSSPGRASRASRGESDTSRHSSRGAAKPSSKPASSSAANGASAHSAAPSAHGGGATAGGGRGSVMHRMSLFGSNSRSPSHTGSSRGSVMHRMSLFGSGGGEPRDAGTARAGSTRPLLPNAHHPWSLLPFCVPGGGGLFDRVSRHVQRSKHQHHDAAADLEARFARMERTTDRRTSTRRHVQSERRRSSANGGGGSLIGRARRSLIGIGSRPAHAPDALPGSGP